MMSAVLPGSTPVDRSDVGYAWRTNSAQVHAQDLLLIHLPLGARIQCEGENLSPA
jgi:hypothetical protein